MMPHQLTASNLMKITSGIFVSVYLCCGQVALAQDALQSCFKENFSSTGGIDSSWNNLVSDSQSENPWLMENRLRLTDVEKAIQKPDGSIRTQLLLVQAAAVTKNFKIPSSGTTEIHFRAFAYGSKKADGTDGESGADGISVILSDWGDGSIPKVGGVGEALGYSHRTPAKFTLEEDGSIKVDTVDSSEFTSEWQEGFEGGWLGIGIDEFGRYATKGRGKNGGADGDIKNSITVRGSYKLKQAIARDSDNNPVNEVDGSGEPVLKRVDGYHRLYNSGTLSPIIDKNSTGHDYLIRSESLTGASAQAFLTIERDTGQGFKVVVPRFDVMNVMEGNTLIEQKAIPEFLRLSFGASTGGLNNIHEVAFLDVKSSTCSSIQSISVNNQAAVIDYSNQLVTFTVELSQPAPEGGIDINYFTLNGSALSGEEFAGIESSSPKTLQFKENETIKKIAIPLLNLQTEDNGKQFYLRIQKPMNSQQDFYIGDANSTATLTNTTEYPTATAQSAETDEDTPISITLAGTDSDGSIVSYRYEKPAKGIVTGTGPNVTYQPNKDFVGKDTFQFWVTDNDGLESAQPAVVTISVTSINDVPQADNQDITLVENQSANITLTATDIEGIASYDWNDPQHGVIEAGTPPNQITYVPHANYVGDDAFGFTATDTDGAKVSATINLTVLRDLDDDGTPDVDDNDDDGDGIDDIQEGHGDTDGDGIPDSQDRDSDNDGIEDRDEGSDDSDGDGKIDSQDVDSDNDGLLDAQEGSTLDSDRDGLLNFRDIDSDNDGMSDGSEAGLSGTDIDDDGIDDAMDIDVTQGTDANNDGIDDGFRVDNADGDALPNHLDHDSDNDGLPDVWEATLVREDKDDDGIWDQYDVDFTQGDDENSNGVDDRFDVAIVLGWDADKDHVNDGLAWELDYDQDGLADWLDTDSDNDGILDTAESRIAGNDSDSDGIDDAFDIDFIGGQDTNLDGVVDEYVPVDGDSDGVADRHDLDSDNDGWLDTQEAGVTDDDLDGFADAGFAAISDPQNSDDDKVADFRDLDRDNDSIFDIAVGFDAELDLDSDGRIDPTEDRDRDGIDDARDQSDDRRGTFNTSPYICEVPSPENGCDTNMNGFEDKDQAITLKGRDAETDDLRFVIIQCPSRGEFTLDDTDQPCVADMEVRQKAPEWTYTPSANFYGVDRLVYRVRDNRGLWSEPEEVSITVLAVNDAPTARGQNVSLPEDSPPKLIELRGDDLEGAIASYFFEQPNHGRLSGQGNRLFYRPNANFQGEDSFLFWVNDREGLVSERVRVTIRVTPVNDLPEAQDQSLTLTENQSVSIELVAQDVEGIASYQLSKPSHGELEGESPSLIYRPNPSFFGEDHFTFSATDTDGVSVIGNVRMTVLRDLDSDGTPDVRDNDDDGDGIDDIAEGNHDTDGDSIPNSEDRDSDNDGIDDRDEGGVDSDGDGQLDSQDLDTDDDGLLDSQEGGTLDFDHDGVMNFRDIDSDNDGLLDGSEARLSGLDHDGDQIDDRFDVDVTQGADTNHDGVDDAYRVADLDQDGRPNHLDADADGDGLPDVTEAFVLREDKNLNGIVDTYDVEFTGGEDTNRDGIDDAFDVSFHGYLDANKDGVNDGLMVEYNHDNDPLADWLDLDSDNDGIHDGAEEKVSGVDTDEDSIDDAFDVDNRGGEDINQDGVDDALTSVDTDSDGIPDRHDLDSDNDGWLDTQEAEVVDEDQDGLADIAQTSLIYEPKDVDQDGLEDFRSLDSDGDGVFDIELGFSLHLDSNQDGQIDVTEDVDGDGIDDSLDNNLSSRSTDVLSGDSDGDGILDVKEGAEDQDNDGLPNYLDLDSDGDTLMDHLEGTMDTDRDGVSDFLDLDSDNDGILDRVEGANDLDGDGKMNFRDIDSDADGLLDEREKGDFDGNGVQDYKELPRVVETGIDDGISGGGSIGFLGVITLLLLSFSRSLPCRMYRDVCAGAWTFLARQWKPIIVVGLFLSLANWVQAQEDEFNSMGCRRGVDDHWTSCLYVGAGLGNSKLQPKTNDTGWEIQGRGQDQSYQLLSGMSFTEHWFSELYYQDLGRVSLRHRNPAVTRDLEIPYHNWGVTLGYRFGLPSDRVRSYAKLIWSTLEADNGEPSQEVYRVQQIHKRRWGAAAGFELAFASHWFARLGVESDFEDAQSVNVTVARYFGGSRSRIRVEKDTSSSLSLLPTVSSGTEETKPKEKDKYKPLPSRHEWRIHFDNNSSVIKPEFLSELTVLAEDLQRFPQSVVWLVGHTDNRASHAHNQRLSHARAHSVADRLQTSCDGCDLDVRLDAVRDLQPLTDNKTPAGRAMNRRVDLLINWQR